jgi:hypothetical protein
VTNINFHRRFQGFHRQMVRAADARRSVNEIARFAFDEVEKILEIIDSILGCATMKRGDRAISETGKISTLAL